MNADLHRWRAGSHESVAQTPCFAKQILRGETSSKFDRAKVFQLDQHSQSALKFAVQVSFVA